MLLARSLNGGRGLLLGSALARREKTLWALAGQVPRGGARIANGDSKAAASDVSLGA